MILKAILYVVLYIVAGSFLDSMLSLYAKHSEDPIYDFYDDIDRFDEHLCYVCFWPIFTFFILIYALYFIPKVIVNGVYFLFILIKYTIKGVVSKEEEDNEE